MKYWSNEHQFEHSWQTVVEAALQKYPNPENQNVVGIDVLDQRVRADGVLQNERILKSKFNIPEWASKISGYSGHQYSLEYSEIDPKKKEMTLLTRNLNCADLIRMDEKLIYTPHPKEPNKTTMKQEARISVNLPLLADYCERHFLSIYQSFATKGPKGLEWVIGQLADEFDNGLRQISESVDSKTANGNHSIFHPTMQADFWT